MIVRGKTGVSTPIAFGLALLLIVLVVGAGLLWLREAEARLSAEQELSQVQENYKSLQTECDALQSGGQQTAGVNFSGAQDPVLAGLSEQTDIPQCEKPTMQPYQKAMRAQSAKFFAQAQEGDVLVSFPASRVAYLYRPATETLINAAQLPPSQPQAGAQIGN